MPNASTASSDPASAGLTPQPLAELCAGVLPVWARHLATSRAQSEAAVSQMLAAFAHIAPHMDGVQRQAQQIQQALHPGNASDTTQSLAQACEQALAPLMADPQLRAVAAPAVAQVLELVRHAADALQTLAQPATAMADTLTPQIEQMYLGFQYQDRISQMMALLEQDMARLQAALAVQSGNEPTPTLAQWLARLESHYAMAEQHHGAADAAHSPDALGASGKDETIFF